MRRFTVDINLRFHVYVDWIVVDGLNHIIYVGKGTLQRCVTPLRNKKHASLWLKYDGKRAIISSFADEVGALSHEKDLISKYGTFIDRAIDETFACNFTSGGEGHEHCDAVREIISKRTKKAMNTYEMKLRLSRSCKKAQSRLETREKRRATNALSEVKKRKSEAQKIAQNRQDVKEHAKVVQKIAQNRQSTKDKKSISIRNAHARLETKEKIQRIRNDQAYKERHRTATLVAVNRPEVKVKKLKTIQQSTFDGTIIASFESPKEASRVTGVNRGNMCSCARGEVIQAGGYVWKFA